MSTSTSIWTRYGRSFKTTFPSLPLIFSGLLLHGIGQNAECAGREGPDVPPGPGSRDNAKFNILNGKLRTAGVFNYATRNVYKVRVRVTDQGGLWYEKAMVVGVTHT